MHLVGELADFKAVEKIIQDLKKHSIDCQLTTDHESQLHCLWVQEEKDLAFAMERFRVALGFRKALEIDPEWEKIGKIPLGQISLSCILISIIVFVCLQWIPFAEEFVKGFFISDGERDFLYEVRRGEIWRLLTPIFLHFGFMHIFFNLMWLKDIGSLIEHAKGQRYFIFLVVSSGILSNFGQLLVGGPAFGGMSGVIYALFGMIWVHRKFSEDFDYELPKRDVYLMIGFFIACMSGVFGPIANMAHAIGLSIGMIWGMFPITKGDLKKAFSYGLLALIFSLLALIVEFWKREGQLYFSQI